jgi:hypothetical protein
MRVQSPGINEFKQFYWSKALNWSQGPLDEGSRPKSGKLRLNLHGTCFEGKINWFGPKNSAKRRAPDLENQRIKFRDQCRVQLKDSICFKSVQIGPSEIGPCTFI